MSTSPLCERVQSALVESGPGAFKDDAEARAHLVDCAECFGVLEASASLDAEIAAAPVLDAPDALVTSTLARIATEAGLDSPEPKPQLDDDNHVPAIEELEPESAAEQAALTAAIAQAAPKPGSGKATERGSGRVADGIARAASRVRNSFVGWIAVKLVAIPWAALRWLGAKLRPLSTPFTKKIKERWTKTSPLMRRWITVSALGGGTAMAALMLLVMVTAVGGDSPVGMTGVWEEGQLEIPKVVEYKRSQNKLAKPSRPASQAFAGNDYAADKSELRSRGLAQGIGSLGDDDGRVGNREASKSGVLKALEGGAGGLGTGFKNAADPNTVGGEIAAAPEEPMPAVAPVDTPAPAPPPPPMKKPVPSSSESTGSKRVLLDGLAMRTESIPEPVAEPEPEPERFRDRKADAKPSTVVTSPTFEKVTVHGLARTVKPAELAMNEGDGDELAALGYMEGSEDEVNGDLPDMDFDDLEEEESLEEEKSYKGKDQIAQVRSQLQEQNRRDYRQNAAPMPDNQPTGRLSGLLSSGKEGKKAEKKKRKRNKAEEGRASERWAQLQPVDTRIAENFLLERARLDGLTFKNPIGYWANTYVPGDPELRLLQSKLEGYDRSTVAQFAGGAPRMHDAASTYAQPFDPPTGAALGVYLNGSESAVEGPTRMLLQVGLQGTPRYSGRRPAMNIGVVLDLRGSVDREASTAMRALLTALNDSQDITDRFTLVVAGKPGGVVLEPESFRHGPLMVTTRRLFSDSSIEELEPSPTLSLPEAVQEAMGAVAQSDDPTAPLGSSSVLLVTSQSIAGLTGMLSEMAHASAVNGVPVSTVGIGGGARPEELATVTLAGQGNRRLLSNASEARDVVDRELSAVARVVARAVRLRIRLAPGVKLIDIIGSHSLSEERAERVRQAEQSIDRRLSRNLGLVSDRGEDEDGVQIVIPSYYAGDSHTILLDVVVPKAGPVADVRVRFKDLVYLKNGVAAATYQIPRGNRPKGPLQYSVLKNLVAHDVAQSLRKSSEALARGGDIQSILAPLQNAQQLVTGLPQLIPGFWSDRGLNRDLAMLREYIRIVQAGAHSADRDHIRDSLRFAGFLKVQPRPPQ